MKKKAVSKPKKDVVRVIPVPDSTAEVKKTSALITKAKALDIQGVDDHKAGKKLWDTLAGMEKTILDLFKEAKSLANQAHKAITTAEKTLLKPILAAKSIVNMKCIDFVNTQKELALAKERKRQAEQDKRDREAKEAEIKAAEEAGEKDLAEEIKTSPVTRTTVARVAPQVYDDIPTGVNWSAEVDNMRLLVEYVVQNPQYLHLLQPCQPEINTLARAQRDSLSIPGIRVIKSEGMRRG